MTNTGLTVAVTGPTGDLGLGIVDALERSRAVKRIVGMARRPFDPAERGWRKTEYRQGDVTDKASVRGLVKDAHVVVHLAFAVLDAELRHPRPERRGLAARLRGVRQGRRRAHLLRVERRRLRLPRRQPRLADRGHPGARLARVPLLAAEGRGGAGAGGHAAAPAPHQRLRVPALHRRRARGAHDAPGDPLLPAGEAMPDVVVRLLGSVPALKPVIPDPGARFQLVHSDDVARAFVAGVRGVGEPGPYNLAGGGTLTFSHLASALGWYSVPIPKVAAVGHRRDRHAPAVHPRGGRLAALGAQAGADEDRPRPQAAQVEAAALGAADARGDVQGAERGRARRREGR